MTNKFLQGVPVFYINLERSIERRRYIKNHFKENQVENFYRISAVDGDILEIEFPELHMNKYQVAVMHSHMTAMLKFLETEYEFAAIAEDDIDISNISKINFNFYETLQYHNPEDYCLQMQVIVRDFFLDRMSLKIVDGDMNYWGAGFYIVNRNFAEKFIKTYFKNGALNEKSLIDMWGAIDYSIYRLGAYCWPILRINENYVKSSVTPNDAEHLMLKSNEYIDKYIADDISIEDVFKKQTYSY